MVDKVVDSLKPLNFIIHFYLDTAEDTFHVVHDVDSFFATVKYIAELELSLHCEFPNKYIEFSLHDIRVFDEKEFSSFRKIF